jgi:hypothetical protein
MLCVTIGLLLFSQIDAASSAQDVVTRLVVVGIGFGLFSSPNTSAVMGSVRGLRLGVAAGTLGTMRFMGQSIGLALLGTVMATTMPAKTLLAIFAGFSVQGSVAVSQFILGMRTFFLVASVIGGLATAISLVRGHENVDA